MTEEIQKRMRYVTEIIRKLKTKPRASSTTQNDENRRPTTAARSGTSLKHSTDSHNKEKPK
jgi:hypothetical protein